MSQIWTFNPTSTGKYGTIQNWVVPSSGNYVITAYGAEGGRDTSSHLGGKGARITGTVALTAGTTLKILVGQKGEDGRGSWRGGGGGGGSFVTLSNNSPLIVAGGGGGGGNYEVGQGGLTSTSGGTGTVNGAGAGGTNGNGGAGGTWASGGAGLNSNGGANASGNPGGSTVPIAFITNGNGGVRPTSWADTADGGFGGGGWAYAGGAGGGGYSGGGGGGWSYCGRGGGGGSFNSGSNQINQANSRTGSGIVTIEALFIPPSVQTLGVENIKMFSAEFNGSFSHANSDSFVVGFHYTSAHENIEVALPSQSPGNFAAFVNTLSKNTVYEVRAFAKMGSEYWYGSSIEFQTPNINLKYKVNGQYKDIHTIYCKINGDWKIGTGFFKKTLGGWKG